MFAACVGITGYVPLPLTGDDYIELLPAVFRTVNDYGLTIDNRTYDCKALNPYRRLDSGLPGGNKRRWEVHHDPYDITVVWLRDHRSEEWVTVPRGSTGPWPDSPPGLLSGSTVVQRADGHASQFGYASHGQVLFHATDYAA